MDVDLIVAKSCLSCGEVKSIDEFVRTRRAKSGYKHECKPCMKARFRMYYVRNRDAVLSRNRRYYQTPKGIAVSRETNYRMWKKYPDKQRARQKFLYAVRKGLLVRPEECEKCGETGRIQGHHPDYTKPFDVVWLCMMCHKAEHYQPINEGIKI